MLVVDVQNAWQSERFEFPEGAVEFGRMPESRGGPVCLVNDPHVSKRQLSFLPLAGGRVRLENLSQLTFVRLEDGSLIEMGGKVDVALPVELTVGKTRIRLNRPDPLADTQPTMKRPELAEEPSLIPAGHPTPPYLPQPSSQAVVVKPPTAKQVGYPTPPTLSQPTHPTPPRLPQPGEIHAADDLLSPTDKANERARLKTVQVPNRGRKTDVLKALGEAPTPEALARWFETVIEVQQSAATSSEFYQQTADALCKLIGLDVGLVLLKKGKNWEVVGRSSTERGADMGFSRTTLNFVAEERRTFYHGFGDDAKVASRSLQDAKAVVAAPVFDYKSGEVVGALYGSASLFGFGRSGEIRPLEAQVVQVLAAAVGVGLSRMEQEKEAARRRVQFEQFFSPLLVRELDRDPTLLDGRDREVTMLFTDIRRFSQISERLGPRQTCVMVRDVMERITGCVADSDGVVVDYYGDGLCAMWNAPIDQPDHARRAARTALNVLRELPAIDAQWREIVGHSITIGLGLNTGPAMVGNTGTQRKFKYGAMGKTVNMASRVEGATKHLGVPVLASASTVETLTGEPAPGETLAEEFLTRRVGKVLVVGCDEPLELFELRPGPADEAWTDLKRHYERAWSLYEQGRWESCLRELEGYIEGSTADPLSAALAKRAEQSRKNPLAKYDPIWRLEGK